jgi:hypothetical protein
MIKDWILEKIGLVGLKIVVPILLYLDPDGGVLVDIK